MCRIMYIHVEYAHHVVFVVCSNFMRLTQHFRYTYIYIYILNIFVVFIFNLIKQYIYIVPRHESCEESIFGGTF